MDNVLNLLSRLIVARPYVTLAVLLVMTVILGSGITLRSVTPETAELLPKGSAVADALEQIDELFGDADDVRIVTLLFRGDAMTPSGLNQMASLLEDIVREPDVGELLTPTNSVFAPSALVMSLLEVNNLEAVTQEDIDTLEGPPEVLSILDAMTGTDAEGAPVAVASIRLIDSGDDQVDVAERRIDAMASADEGPLRVSSISYIVIDDEGREYAETALGPLMGLALLLVAGLILLFMRTISDLLLTLGGLIISMVWIIGGEGWLGPNGLGITGAPNSLTGVVPIIVIGLTVDYAIQAVSHYREHRNAGEEVSHAVRLGLQNVSVPLMLAAVTTIVSLLTALFSPVKAVGDFGIIAAMGVAMGFVVMLTLMPAGRLIIDHQREARGTLKPPRPVSGALPGIERGAEFLGRQVTRRPAPYIIAVILVTIGLGFAATDIKSEFSVRDILPRGGSVLEDLNTLDTAIGGSTEMINVLVKAEVTETRTLLNLQDLRAAFEDERRRPPAVAGPIVTSYELLVQDWITDSGVSGDKYDAELAALFEEATASIRLDAGLMQEFVDRLEVKEPGTEQSLLNNPNGIDTLLIQFPAYLGDPDAIRELQGDIDDLWLGDDDAITATSETVVQFASTDAIRDRQTEAIGTTVAVALGILTIFFWLTVRQPTLAFVAVVPTVFVLISVLGTMALLNIPYSIVTSMITALSIGIGVDYTIHMIHRYREEFARGRDPEKAAVQTLATTGSALLGSGLTTALGIGVLAVSPLGVVQQFGITVAITIGYALIVSVLLVPPAMTVWGSYQNMRLRSMIQRQWDELDVAIDEIHRRHSEQ